MRSQIPSSVTPLSEISSNYLFTDLSLQGIPTPILALVYYMLKFKMNSWRLRFYHDFVAIIAIHWS